MKQTTLASANIIRNLVFGIMDSVVSTVGLISGVAVAGVAPGTLLMTGMVLIFVEAFSMGAGSILSDNSAQSYTRHRVVPLSRSLIGGIVMFGVYVAAGFVIILPYVFLSTTTAFAVSVAVAMMLLLLLGAFGALMAQTRPGPAMARMGLIGGSAIILGVLVGKVFQI